MMGLVVTILLLMLILPLPSARLEPLQVAFELYCQSPRRTSCALNSLTACNSNTAVTGVLSVVPLDVIHDGFLSSVTRLKHRSALLYEKVVSVVAADYRRGRLSGVVVQEGYRMVSIVGCRKEADDLEWKGMVFVGGLKQPSFSSNPV
jgi:hypothetical protein